MSASDSHQSPSSMFSPFTASLSPSLPQPCKCFHLFKQLRKQVQGGKKNGDMNLQLKVPPPSPVTGNTPPLPLTPSFSLSSAAHLNKLTPHDVLMCIAAMHEHACANTPTLEQTWHHKHISNKEQKKEYTSRLCHRALRCANTLSATAIMHAWFKANSRLAGSFLLMCCSMVVCNSYLPNAGAHSYKMACRAGEAGEEGCAAHSHS